MYNKELDKLLCLLDGKITNYRFKNQHNTYLAMDLIEIQNEIQKLWKINKGVE